MKKQKIICVVGPTASGKTGLGIELAKCFDGEVISADSMQIYKGMDIGTAKPSAEEQNCSCCNSFVLLGILQPQSNNDKQIKIDIIFIFLVIARVPFVYFRQ